MATHSHDHDHDLSHSHTITSLSSAFFVAIFLNSLFSIIEAYFGFKIHSLALLSDAGHNAMDVLNLILSWIAIWMSRLKNNSVFTYGYRRASMMAALINSLLLLTTSAYLIYEAIERFANPMSPSGSTMIIIASIGVLVNGLSSLFLLRGSKTDVNIKSAFLHLVGDALVSVWVIIAGVTIYYTWYTWVDPIISILVSLVMIWSVIDVLKKSVRMNLDGTPAEIDAGRVRTEILKISWVKDVHHIHIWSLSTTENALTAHVVFDSGSDEKNIKKLIRCELEHLGIKHITLETEQEICEENHCI